MVLNCVDDVEVFKIQTVMDFTTEYMINNSKYNFHGKKYGIEWVIGLDQVGEFNFNPISHDIYLQKLFGGFFKSLRVLIHEQQVKILSFVIPTEYVHVRKFINSVHFRGYLEEHLGMNFFENDILHGMNYWRYEKL
ncbi:MAG: hypothetical protein EOL95_11135 [Bacteroidia bacterium]|nr:hypothetical protein [Bacteroidia bacterium]